MDIFLAFFLALNAFFIGVFVTWAFRHWDVHLRRQKPTTASSPQIEIPSGLREQMIQMARDRLEQSLVASSTHFGTELDKTSARLNSLLEKFGSDIVSDEMNLFQSRLKELREEAEQSLHGAQSQIKAHQAELEAAITARRQELEKNLADEIAAERQTMIKQIDTKLSDAMTSFLLESLGHNVDLGAQTPYLISLLDEHKDELKKEVGYEGTAPTT